VIWPQSARWRCASVRRPAKAIASILPRVVPRRRPVRAAPLQGMPRCWQNACVGSVWPRSRAPRVSRLLNDTVRLRATVTQRARRLATVTVTQLGEEPRIDLRTTGFTERHAFGALPRKPEPPRRVWALTISLAI